MTTRVEHRWGQRVAANIPVVLTRGGTLLGSAHIASVSLSGAMLTTSLDLPLYANLTVLPNGGDPFQECIPASVIRKEPGSIAIEWRDMASPQVVALIRSLTPGAAALDTRDPCAA